MSVARHGAQACHVLIVEDNPDLADNVSELFIDMGAEVRIRSAAAEAEELAARWSVDLALVDLRLQGMETGLALAGRLHDLSPGAEVILMTGNATLDTAIEAVRAGVFAYVQKPFDPESLLRLGQRAIDRVHLRREREVLARELATREALYRGVVDNVEAFIVGIGDDGEITFCNRFAHEVSGHTAEEAYGRPFADMCDASEHAPLQRAVRKALAGERVTDIEHRLQTASGPVRVVRWTLSPAGTGGESAAVLGIGIDVTDHVALEQHAAQSRAMAVMGTLTAGLAHEIRNPLNAAKLQLELLTRRARRLDDDEMRESMTDRVGIVQTELDRLTHMLDDFLSLARPRSINREPFAMVELLAEVRELQRPLAQREHVELVVACDEGVGDVRADRGKMKQVLINFVMNALDALRGKEGGQVVLGATREGRRVTITVDDTGPGLPVALQGEKAFEPFLTTKEAGTGLGLAIVRQIVTAHAGEVELLPREGGGVVARVVLPEG